MSSYYDDACYPGNLEESNCYPCYPCGPDTSCNPRNSSDEDMDCYPCRPCNPDTDSRCYPCSPCSPDTRNDDDDDSSSGSGCFLTSACVEAIGLTDDCEELTRLRVLRDKRRLFDESFADLVKDYYHIAPTIVSNIESKPTRLTIYHRIYDELVAPCVELIKKNKENDAIQKYTEYVLKLKTLYFEETGENNHAK